MPANNNTYSLHAEPAYKNRNGKEKQLHPEMKSGLLQEVGKVSRNSPAYIKWVQSSLNKILRINLAVDGISGTHTKSAIRSFQSRQRLTVDGIVGPVTEAALIRSGAGNPPGNQPVYPPTPPVVPPVIPVTGNLRGNLVGTALQEWNRWGKGSKKENDPAMQTILKDYWVTGTGSDYGYRNNGYWSAAFISWVVKKAGGGTNFQYSGAHTTYTYGAKQNRLQNNANPFKAYRISEKKPEPGDIIVQNRGSSTFTYDNLQPDKSGTHGDIVVKVNAGSIEVLGGNLSDSVSLNTYNLTPDGFLNSSKHFAIIKIEESVRTGYNEFETELYPEMEFALPAPKAVSRNSPAYIKWVQASLNRIMGLLLVVDGKMGPITRNAVRNFQKQKGLTVDGIVGPITERAIQLALVQPARVPPTTLPPTIIPAVFPVTGTVTPPLLSTDSSVPASTLYVNINLGNGNTQTGIFIPQKFSSSQSVDLIIYLHGYKKSSIPIERYWNAKVYPQYALREEVNNSNSSNVIFVAPTLGTRSEAGTLIKPGGFDDYINQVIAAINEYYIKEGSKGEPLKLRNIILSAHSGGGSPMLKIALAKNTYNSRITECWAFDSLYQGVDEWLSWATSPDKKLFVYYLGSTSVNALSLKAKAAKQGKSNIVVTQSSKGHDWVPKLHLKERIENMKSSPQPLNPEFEGLDLYMNNETDFEGPTNSQLNIFGEKGGGRLTLKTDPVPANRADVKGYGGITHVLHKHTKVAYENLVQAARMDGIAEPFLQVASAYRSSATQKVLWEKALAKYGSAEEARKWVAPPGGSAHQSGRAIDFWMGSPNGKEYVSRQRQTSVFAWLSGNASRFGFYPYETEPWHWEHNPLPNTPANNLLTSPPQYTVPTGYTPGNNGGNKLSAKIQKAIKANLMYSQTLGWINYVWDIESLLGFIFESPTEERFAEAVSAWQGKNGLVDDGIIGKFTWQKMRQYINTG